MIEFDTLSKENLEEIRKYRNKNPQALRTPYKLTKEMQSDFYNNVINNRNSNNRFFAVYNKEDKDRFIVSKFDGAKVKNKTYIDDFIGMVGLENIQWENSIAEISIIILDKYQKKGFGTKILNKILEYGFYDLNLENIYGECYQCNESIKFWEKMIKEYGIKSIELPNRKYYQGEYFDSIYFNFKSSNFYFYTVKD